MAYNSLNKLLRDKKVIEITVANYVPGVSTYSEIWAKYVNPLYPMCYITYLKIINTPNFSQKLSEEKEKVRKMENNS